MHVASFYFISTNCQIQPFLLLVFAVPKTDNIEEKPPHGDTLMLHNESQMGRFKK